MFIQEVRGGQLILHGRGEEWQRLGPKLDAVCAELRRDVLPAARRAANGAVQVSLRQAWVIMAIMEDRELTRTLLRIVLDTGLAE
jgi:hypothetical protein